MTPAAALPRLFISTSSALLSILLFLGTAMSRQTDTAIARELAAKIVSVAGRTDLARISVREGNGVSASEAEQFGRALQAELRRLGFGMTRDATTGATIDVTFSAALPGTVIVAEVRSGDTKSVAMALGPAAGRAQATDRAAPVTLQLQPLVMRAEPILAVLPIEDSLLVLGAETVALQPPPGNDSGRQVAAITHNQPWPRDLRGLLASDGVSLQVYLPGTRCKGTVRPLALACSDSQEPWPLDGGEASLSPGRNYFESQGIIPFYTSVRVRSAESEYRLVSGTDGECHLYNSKREAVAVVDGMGDDLTALRTTCGSGTQILASTAGENGRSEYLQAFEWVDLQAKPASTAMRLPGRVTALWPAAGGASAVLAVHNTEAGRYEAYRVTVACSR